MIVVAKQTRVDALNVVTFNKTARQHVREFGCIIAVAAYLIASVKLVRNGYSPSVGVWAAFGTLFVALGYSAPRIMLPVWRLWMKFAVALGAVMSTIMVSLAWLVMFFPIGIIFKMIGKRVMDLSFDRSVNSYWEHRDEKLSDFKLLERQY